jgi:glycosyltransferase involved in cell wall biosynthesis
MPFSKRTNSREPLKIYASIFGKQKVPYSGFANVNKESTFSKASRWIRGNLFIPDARKGWNKFALRRASELLKERQIECIITSGPPHSTHLVGLSLKKEFGVRWIADFRDPWTDIYYYDDLLLTAKSRKKDENLEKQVLDLADSVIAVCQSNAELFKQKIVGSRSKVKVVSNGFDTDDFHTASKSENEVFTIVYMGTLADTYRPRLVFEAFDQLDIDFKLLVVGKVSPEIEEFISKSAITEKVNFKGYVNHDEALDYLRNADLLLHILPATPGADMGTTGKLFEYLAAQTPILNIGSPESDSGKIIKECGAGESFSREDGNGINQFVRNVEKGEFNVSGDINKYSRKELARKLSTLIHDE